MTAKNIAQLTIATIFSIALIVFTKMGIVPTEVFVGFVGVAITWVFKEVEKEREIARLMKKLGGDKGQ